MSDNGRHEFDLTPEGRVTYLESLLEVFDAGIDYTPVFVEHLDYEDPRVRIAAIRGLWYLPDSGLIDRLIEMIDQDPSAEVRAAAVSGLGIYVYEGQMAAFEDDLDDSEMLDEGAVSVSDLERLRSFLLDVYADETRTLDERRFAVESLSFLNDPEIGDLIQQTYHRPEKDMKVSALFAMGRSGLARWFDILSRELYNADRDLQREAIRAVGEIGMDELGQDIWRLTYADDKEVMLDAIEALGQTGWEEGFERLDELTSSPDPEIAEVAEEALEEWYLMSEIARQVDDWDEDEWDEDDVE
jgi:HEAT repeat protein